MEEASRVEALLARELEKLSLDELEKITFEVHGVTTSFPEEEVDSMVNMKLEELDQVLNHIEQKDAYDLARQWNSSYVTSRQFRLMFLRCHSYDTQAAAEMIVNHFEEKRRLFGDGEILARDVRQSDFSDEGRIILESGFVQVLPTCDASGRTIILLSSAGVEVFQKNEWDEKNEFRTIWYLSMARLRDEESQKAGTVWLILNSDCGKVTMEYFVGLDRTEAAIPNRLIGGHFCYTDPSLRPYVAGLQLLTFERDRNRLRTHFGTREEIDFALNTFGIPIHDCPVSIDGTFSNATHRKWLAELRAQEEKEFVLTVAHPNVLECTPKRFDVLFGKSIPAREHTGTLRALHLVQMHFPTYEKLSKLQKTDIADSIILIIHESGGRFLKQNNTGCWIEASDIEARNKIAHWFRHARNKKCKEQQLAKKSKCILGDGERLLLLPSVHTR